MRRPTLELQPELGVVLELGRGRGLRHEPELALEFGRDGVLMLEHAVLAERELGRRAEERLDGHDLLPEGAEAHPVRGVDLEEAQEDALRLARHRGCVVHEVRVHEELDEVHVLSRRLPPQVLARDHVEEDDAQGPDVAEERVV